jgi:hypothetical protein
VTRNIAAKVGTEVNDDILKYLRYISFLISASRRNYDRLEYNTVEYVSFPRKQQLGLLLEFDLLTPKNRKKLGNLFR